MADVFLMGGPFVLMQQCRFGTAIGLILGGHFAITNPTCIDMKTTQLVVVCLD